MFKGNKYITKGVQANIPLYLQALLWYMVEAMEVNEKDYLQIFELNESAENGKVIQHIIHRQESPVYKEEHFISAKKAINDKVYIIDDGDLCTMLLSEEY